MTTVSYAQNYEDVMLARALREIEDGFYIDVGAQDPIDDSVTKMFYEMGWRGINIEPVTHWYEKLLIDRPHDTNLQVAVSDRRHKLNLYEVVNSGLSTTDADIAKRHAEQGYTIKQSRVQCVTLNSICKKYRIKKIHFLKVDCEGGEAAALRGLSLDRIRPWIILVEATEPNSQKAAYVEWEPLLTDNSYHFVYKDGLNRFYVADERGELDEAFSHPPNVFDRFVRASEFDARETLRSVQGDIALMRDAQRVVTAETVVHTLRERIDHLKSENERRESSLVQLRASLAEATSTHAEEYSAEQEQWRTDVEWLHSENERREVALVELRSALADVSKVEGARESERLRERDQWRTDVEWLHDENERREAALVGLRSALAGVAEMEEARESERLRERDLWRADFEQLRNENERWRALLIERDQSIATLNAELAASRQAESVAVEQARSLVEDAEQREVAIASLHIDAEHKSSEILRLETEIDRLHHEVLLRDREVQRLQTVTQDLLGSTSWRVTSPLRWLKRAIRLFIGALFWLLYQLVRWPARLARPMLRQLAHWRRLRSAAVWIVGEDSRFVATMRLFLFGAPQDLLAPDKDGDELVSEPLTRHATRVLQEMEDAKARAARSDGRPRSRRM